MSTLLQISTSIHSHQGQSTRLADRFVQRWQAAHPGGRVIHRNLTDEPVPHLDAERFAAFTTPADGRNAAQQAIVAYSDELIAELKAADVIVLGLPMYNFGIPSQLKAYFDHVARAGVTFRYTAAGPEGLLGGRTVYVFAARGGQYAGLPTDWQSGFVRFFLNFLGLSEVEIVYAEGLALGAAAQQEGLAAASAHIDRLTLAGGGAGQPAA